MKHLKITLVLIFFIGIFQNVFSQQLKTYQGPYEKGNATYQYYEDESLNRIYQGTFKYTADHISIIGQYKENKREGKWIITKTVLPPLDNFKETITGEYVNGNMEGSWNLVRVDLKTKKTLAGSDAYFINGYIRGSFLYYKAKFKLQSSETTPLIINGKFNAEGKLDSTWTIEYKRDGLPFEDIRKFKNGETYFHLLRNVSTGEIIEKYDNPTSPEVYDINSYTTTTDLIKYLKETPDIIFSSAFELWKRIKTPNSYLFEDPYIVVRSSGEELLDIF